MWDIDEKLKKFYLAGRSRGEARKEFGLSSNSISSKSSRLGLQWSLRKEMRKIGLYKKPPSAPVAQPRQTYLTPSRGFVSSVKRRESGYETADELRFGGRKSPFPTPCEELPLDTLHFLIHHLYPPISTTEMYAFLERHRGL